MSVNGVMIADESDELTCLLLMLHGKEATTIYDSEFQKLTVL